MTDISRVSPTAERYARQLGLYNPEDRQNDKVTFIGVGGIGSFAAFATGKLGVPNITLIDPDVCETHNVPNQFYTPHHANEGTAKVEAMSEQIARATDPVFPEIETYQLALPHDDVPALDGLVVSGLDSMKARREIWESCVKLKPAVTRYIDARISGEFIVIYTVNPSSIADCRSYELTLHGDDEGEELLCTERGIIDVGMQAGSILTNMVRRHFNGADITNITMMNMASYVSTQGGWVE